MKLWLDDIRPMPADFDVSANSAERCIELLSAEVADMLSFDHDLGLAGAGTGYDVAKWIEHEAAQGRRRVKDWRIHSANPVGRQNIEAAMRSADRMLEEVQS